MNELEARRRLLADPRQVPPELETALSQSPALRDFRAELLRRDAQLQHALTRPEVPAGLADRIVLRARYRERSRWALALAASVAALGIAIAIAFAPTLRDAPLETAMLSHVATEVDELQDNAGVAPAVLRASVRTLGVEVRDAGYRVRHLANCVIAGREGRHFTVDGPHGVVSFVVLPSSGEGSGKASLLQRQAMKGFFMPIGGMTLGVVAEGDVDRAQLEQLARQVFVIAETAVS